MGRGGHDSVLARIARTVLMDQLTARGRTSWIYLGEDEKER